MIGYISSTAFQFSLRSLLSILLMGMALVLNMSPVTAKEDYGNSKWHFTLLTRQFICEHAEQEVKYLKN